MDNRIRAAERAGDRRRLLVELYRAGRPVDYQVGDFVRVIDYPAGVGLDREIRKIILGNEYEVKETRKNLDYYILIRPPGYQLLLTPSEVEPA